MGPLEAAPSPEASGEAWAAGAARPGPPGWPENPYEVSAGAGASPPEAGASSVVSATAGAGVAWTGAGAVSVTSPATAEPMTAMGVPTSTVSPSSTRICTSVPAAGEGTSESTLSVEISNSVSSCSTSSPTAFFHSKTVPSITLSPILGITTSTPPPVGASACVPPEASGAGAAAGSGVAPGAASPTGRTTGAAGLAAGSASASGSAVAPSPPEAPPPPSIGASTSVSITAMGVPTSTVSFSSTRISTIRPPAGEGTSESTLSVEISSSVSSGSTVSPTAFFHSSTVPSMTLSPILGMTTSTRAILREGLG